MAKTQIVFGEVGGGGKAPSEIVQYISKSYVNNSYFVTDVDNSYSSGGSHPDNQNPIWITSCALCDYSMNYDFTVTIRAKSNVKVIETISDSSTTTTREYTVSSGTSVTCNRPYASQNIWQEILLQIFAQ